MPALSRDESTAIVIYRCSACQCLKTVWQGTADDALIRECVRLPRSLVCHDRKCSCHETKGKHIQRKIIEVGEGAPF